MATTSEAPAEVTVAECRAQEFSTDQSSIKWERVSLSLVGQLYWHVLLFDEAESWTPSSLDAGVSCFCTHTVGPRHLLPYLQSIMSDNKEQQFSIQPHPAKDNGELDDAALTTLAFMHNVDKLRRAERVY